MSDDKPTIKALAAKYTAAVAELQRCTEIAREARAAESRAAACLTNARNTVAKVATELHAATLAASGDDRELRTALEDIGARKR
jgi:hypothetical protein